MVHVGYKKNYFCTRLR